MEDEEYNEWMLEQMRFATSIGQILKDSEIDWSKEISFQELFDLYGDEFTEEDDEDIF